jgi:hypothetical protein
VNRRSFIAALFAPLIAKWMPKPTTTLSNALEFRSGVQIMAAAREYERRMRAEMFKDLRFLNDVPFDYSENMARACACINRLDPDHPVLIPMVDTTRSEFADLFPSE